MEHAEDTQITGTMSDYLVEKLANEEHGQAYAVEYLKADFLTAAAISLFNLRREAGLTQAQVAERLHTKQSAIARLEADFDGAMSLRRYVDFVLACGFTPHQLTFTPIETARTFLIAQPATPLTFENQTKWNNPTFQITLNESVSYTIPSIQLPATTLQEAAPILNAYTSLHAFNLNWPTIQEQQIKPMVVEQQSKKPLCQERAA